LKPLRLVAANDQVSAMLALGNVLDGKQALFVTHPEVNGLMPEVHGLPDEVEDAVGLIVESSGSTGTPKRFELSPEALKTAAIASAVHLGGHGQWLLTLPINYIAGAMVLVRSLIADTQPVLMNTSLPFTAEAFARSAGMMSAARRYTSLVPAQLAKLLERLPEVPELLPAMRRFEAILVGGQAANPKHVKQLRELGLKIVTTYGSAETAGGVVYDGVPLEGVEVSISDSGIIVIDSPTLALNIERPFVTNDLGELVNGELQIRGRADRVINSGGVKLSLESIENWALEHDGVREAVAVSVPNERFGEGFVCFIVREKRFSFDHSRAPLALGIAAKSGQWRDLDSIPKLVSGKPDLQFLSVIANQFGETLG
jgi:O-succinylbenzoic acid--CoA ligase